MNRISAFLNAAKGWILTHKEVLGSSHSRFSSMVTTLLMFCFGVATAFGVTPGASLSPVPIIPFVEDVTVRQFKAVDTPGVYTVQDEVHSGESLGSLFSRLGVNDPKAVAFIERDPKARRIHSLLTSGQPIRVEKQSDGTLVSLRLPSSLTQNLIINRNDDQFQATEIPAGRFKRVVQGSGVIRDSLFAAADAAGIPDQVIHQMTRLFSADVDFRKDLHDGDTFSIVYEATQDDFDHITPGRILAAEFVNHGVTWRRVFYEARNGSSDYFTPDGVGLKTAFLLSPLTYSRVSSGFSSLRLHPILNTWRAHQGIDLAAPTGTPILAVSDATVSFLGWGNGYGNEIELRHAGGYETVYGHLSAFARGLKKGAKVRQGEVIGYVGMTGWATGPHLHYEFKINGRQRDPRGPDVPRYSMRLTGKARDQFLSSTSGLFNQLNAFHGATLARFE
jgi:murein DD-endopeptidase MepM/ murein hydrolase activator NlpD